MAPDRLSVIHRRILLLQVVGLRDPDLLGEQLVVLRHQRVMERLQSQLAGLEQVFATLSWLGFGALAGLHLIGVCHVGRLQHWVAVRSDESVVIGGRGSQSFLLLHCHRCWLGRENAHAASLIDPGSWGLGLGEAAHHLVPPRVLLQLHALRLLPDWIARTILLLHHVVNERLHLLVAPLHGLTLVEAAAGHSVGQLRNGHWRGEDVRMACPRLLERLWIQLHDLYLALSHGRGLIVQRLLIILGEVIAERLLINGRVDLLRWDSILGPARLVIDHYVIFKGQLEFWHFPVQALLNLTRAKSRRTPRRLIQLRLRDPIVNTLADELFGQPAVHTTAHLRDVLILAHLRY